MSCFKRFTFLLFCTVGLWSHGVFGIAIDDEVYNARTGRFDKVRSSATLPSGATHYIHNQDTLQSGATFYVSSGTVDLGGLNIHGTLLIDRPDLTGALDDRSSLTFDPNTTAPSLIMQAHDAAATANSYTFMDQDGNIYGVLDFVPQNNSLFRLQLSSTVTGETALTRYSIGRATGDHVFADELGVEMMRIVDGDLKIPNDGKKICLGDAGDACLEFDGDSWNFVANAVAGPDTMEFTAGGFEFKQGNVGIGVPASATIGLEISSSANAIIQLTDTTNNCRVNLKAQNTIGITGTTTSHDFRILAGNTARMTMKQDTGRVGVGITNPQTLLHAFVSDVAKTPAVGTILTLEDAGTDGAGITILSTSTKWGFIYFADEDSTNVGNIFYNHVTDSMDFKTGNRSRMFMSSGGFTINEEAQDIDFRWESQNQVFGIFGRGSDGFVGIGTAVLTDEFNVAGDIRTTTDGDKYYSGTGKDSYWEFDGNSMNLVANAITATDDMFLTARYVGISSVPMTALAPLHIQVGDVVRNPTNSTTLIVEDSSTDGSGINILADRDEFSFLDFGDQDSSGSGRIFYNHLIDRMDFTVGGVQLMTMKPTNFDINDGSANMNFRMESNDDVFAMVMNGSTGRFGFGIPVPTSHVVIQGSITNGYFSVDTTHDSGGDIFIIDENGNFGFGIVNPGDDKVSIVYAPSDDTEAHGINLAYTPTTTNDLDHDYRGLNVIVNSSITDNKTNSGSVLGGYIYNVGDGDMNAATLTGLTGLEINYGLGSLALGSVVTLAVGLHLKPHNDRGAPIDSTITDLNNILIDAESANGIYTNTPYSIKDLSSWDWWLAVDNKDITFGAGAGGDGKIGFDSDSLNIVANAITPTDEMNLIAHAVNIGTSTNKVEISSAGAMHFEGYASGVPHASFFGTDISSQVINNGIGVPSLVSGLSVKTTYFFTFQNTQELVVQKPGVYAANWSISFQVSGGSNQEIEGSIGIDSAMQGNCDAHRKIGTATDTGNMGAACHLFLEAGDLVQLLVINESSGTNEVVIEHANLILSMIGGT